VAAVTVRLRPARSVATRRAVSGSRGRRLARVLDDHLGLIEDDLRLRPVALGDRALPCVGIEPLGDLAAVPEIYLAVFLIDGLASAPWSKLVPLQIERYV
jgi:hypothetical protein